MPCTTSPLWKFFLADLDGAGITDLSKIASGRSCEVVLNAPLQLTGTVPSDNAQVWLPYTDNSPYLDEGIRLLWGFRRESDTPPFYTVRAATLVQLVEDEAAQDDARTRFTGWDPWKLLMSRPVCNVDGSLPGKNGISFTATQVSTIIAELLANTIANNGHAYIDAGLSYGGTVYYAGTMETGPGMSIDINFPQGTMLGEAWQQLTDLGVCDIVLTPIYDPGYRPNYLVELNVYAQAGTVHNEQIFSWNTPGRTLVGITRQQDGTVRANNVKFFAGQGGSAPGGDVVPVKTDPAAVAKYGEYWAQQFFPGARTSADIVAVGSLAQEQLRLRSNGRTTVTLQPAPERSPCPWVDYNLGDRVQVWASAQGFRKALGQSQTPAGGAYYPTLYFAQGLGASGDLWACTTFLSGADPLTDFAMVGPIGFSVNGIAISPTTGVMYGVSSGSSPELIEIDLETGNGTSIGALGLGSVDEAWDITFTDDGTLVVLILYGVTSYIATVDVATGSASTLGAEDFGDGNPGWSNASAGIEFDLESGYLFVLVDDTIYRVNATTGAIDEPASTHLGGGLCGALAMNPASNLMYMAEQADGSPPTDTHFDSVTVFYNPGGNATSDYIAEVQPTDGTLTVYDNLVAMCFSRSSGSYQRIYGWRANISDDALETIDPLLTSPQGFGG